MQDVEVKVAGRVCGHARVSTEDQNLGRQRDELRAAGATTVIEEKGSGERGADRPKWNALIDSELGPLRAGDTLKVVELSRLG